MAVARRPSPAARWRGWHEGGQGSSSSEICRLVQIVGQVALEPLSEHGSLMDHVHFVVNAKGPVIEVGGTRNAPEMIDAQYFGMNPGRRVLENVGAHNSTIAVPAIRMLRFSRTSAARRAYVNQRALPALSCF